MLLSIRVDLAADLLPTASITLLYSIGSGRFECRLTSILIAVPAVVVLSPFFDCHNIHNVLLCTSGGKVNTKQTIVIMLYHATHLLIGIKIKYKLWGAVLTSQRLSLSHLHR